MLHLEPWHRWVRGIEDFGWIDEDEEYHREEFVKYFTSSSADCLHCGSSMSRVDASGRLAGQEFFCFREWRKCCTIFDIENCVVCAEFPLDAEYFPA